MAGAWRDTKPGFPDLPALVSRLLERRRWMRASAKCSQHFQAFDFQWVAPLIGAGIGGAIWRFLLSPGETPGNLGQDPREHR